MNDEKRDTPETKIKDSNLPARIKNCFAYERKIIYLKQLNGMKAVDLLRMRNMGKKSVKEIQNHLFEMGMSLDFEKTCIQLKIDLQKEVHQIKIYMAEIVIKLIFLESHYKLFKQLSDKDTVPSLSEPPSLLHEKV